MRISQREARRLKARVEQLDRAENDRRSAYVNDWPGGVAIASAVLDPVITAKLHVARLLGHAIVATVRNEKETMFFALPLPESQA